MASPADTSPFLAGPVGDCCLQTVKHSGEARGRSVEIAGVPTYIAEPSSATSGEKRVILFFSDVFGPFYLNSQLLQDYYAAQGFYVFGIDYFFGDPVHLHLEEPGFDRPAWVEKSRQQAIEAVPRWIEQIQKNQGPEAKYSAVGYCFGAPYVLEAAKNDRVVATAFAHPSRLTEDHFLEVTKPLLIHAAEIDNAFTSESRRRAVDILIQKKAVFHLQLFSGVAHGFATRGDISIENTKWAKEESARSIISWFARFS